MTTRDVLVELAAEVFAAEGYASASVRDLGRRAGVTSGAIYGNFRGKADLLAEAVNARLTTDLWTLPGDLHGRSLTDIVGYQFGHYQDRTQLMSLLLEGALAARADDEVKRRLHETIAERLEPSVAAFESRRDAEKFDPDVDLDAVVKILWSIEIGLRVLSVLGVEPPAEDQCSDVVSRFLQGLQVSESKATKKPAVKKSTVKTGRKSPSKSQVKTVGKKRS